METTAVYCFVSSKTTFASKLSSLNRAFIYTSVSSVYMLVNKNTMTEVFLWSRHRCILSNLWYTINQQQQAIKVAP